MSSFLPITDYDFVAGRFKDILKNRRKSKDLTQEQLSNALGVNIKTYRSWEKGTLPNAIDLYNLANLLECDVDIYWEECRKKVILIDIFIITFLFLLKLLENYFPFI